MHTRNRRNSAPSPLWGEGRGEGNSQEIPHGFSNVSVEGSVTRQFAHNPHRQGTVLLVVLVLVFLLPLAAFTFSELMIVEYEAADFYGESLQAQQSADSGIEYIAAMLSDRSLYSEGELMSSPALFQGVLLRAATTDVGDLLDTSGSQPSFSVVAATAATDTAAVAVRFGITNESGKLNLNTLIQLEQEMGLEPEETREFLMYLPGMTQNTADAILDFIDEDSEIRPLGAEQESYVDVVPRNGPLDSIDELAQVIGITADMLYGEDANRNGQLDLNENDGELTLPIDDADGVLLLGWSEFLTVYSKETNLDPEGEEKIFLNDSSLTDLYDILETELGPDEAQFIVAYRLFGPSNFTGVSATSSSGDAETDQALGDLANNLTNAMFGSDGATSTRGGMNLSGGAQFEFASLFDLIDAEVEAKIDDRDETLVSPWTSDPADLSENFPLLQDLLSVYEGEIIEGRINIVLAREEILYGIPEMTVDVSDGILASPLRDPNAQAAISNGLEATTAWLVAEGIADMETMRALAPYITARGDVYHCQVLGHATSGKGPISRVEAIIDASDYPPAVIFRRDLGALGKGYDPATWMSPVDESVAGIP